MNQHSEHQEVNEKLIQLKKLMAVDMISSSSSNKKLGDLSKKLRFWTIFTSGLLTVIIGLSLGNWWGSIGSNIALVLSAILTALNTWDSFTKYEPKSIQEKINANKLTILYKEIMLYESGNSNLKLDDFKQFEQRYKQLQEEYMEDRKSLSQPPKESTPSS